MKPDLRGHETAPPHGDWPQAHTRGGRAALGPVTASEFGKRGTFALTSTGEGALQPANPAARRQPAKPRPAKPISSIAQVEGSGTPATRGIGPMPDLL